MIFRCVMIGCEFNMLVSLGNLFFGQEFIDFIPLSSNKLCRFN